MAEQKKSGPYTEDDMVQVTVDGEVQKDPVPSTWIGTDLLPAGAKKATKAQVEKADIGDTGDGSSTDES